ncbi:MAG: ribonuclease J [Anaerolineales bacterium]|nr:ribonuclease J [Anaerolineales bacterium]HEY62571.1 ribonuclease J [Anaerolineae bacterium]
MSKKTLKIIPLGGLGEVGKNMTAYEYGDNILVVDSGIMFPENDMLGIDYIIPDFDYLVKRKDIIRGIVITHGHEDHTGAIRHVLEEIDAPIYATPLTRGLLEVKLSKGGLLSKADLRTVQAGDTVQIGPFKVEFFHVCHSIPDSVGLGITTPVGLIVHTADYKFDPTPVDGWPTDFAKLAEFSSRGVLALLADSTNADKAGWTPSERVIGPAFDKAFSEAPSRILVASFASLISRMQQVADTAARYGRKMAFAGMSMTENAKMAAKLGYLKIPDGVQVSLDQALQMNPKKVVLMCTGSQGEPTSILGRLSAGTNRRFGIKENDTIILSSHTIPGNEETIYRTINSLFRRGANVLYDPLVPVHVSGHASQDEMRLMIHLVKPKFFIPIHGELRHLKQHAIIAKESGIPQENIAVIENGQIIEFEADSMRLGERIPGGYVFVDGARVGDVGPSVVREREELARDGFVLVSLNLDNNGRLRDDPEIITRGFVYKHEAQELIEATSQHIIETIDNLDGDIHNSMVKAVRSFLYKETKRRPMVFVTLNWS